MKKFLWIIMIACFALSGVSWANLMPNPGFEEGNVDEWGLWGSWGSWWGNSAEEWINDADQAHSGNRCARFFCGSYDYSMAYQLTHRINTIPGEIYYVGAWVKDLLPGGNPSAVEPQFLIWYYNVETSDLATGRDQDQDYTLNGDGQIPTMAASDDGEWTLVYSEIRPSNTHTWVRAAPYISDWSQGGGTSEYLYDDLWFDTVPPKGKIEIATNPDPVNGAVLTNFPGGLLGMNLMWTPGGFAVSHDVYFGDNFDDVNDGTGGTFRGNQTATYFLAGYGSTPNDPIPTGFVPGTTYYWRIDEVNDANDDSPWKGRVWSFSVPPTTAHIPIPPDGSKFIALNADLNWELSLGAIEQTVYFGDDYDTVNTATEGGTSIGSATTYDPGPLELEKVYYWRVETTGVFGQIAGDTWSFRTLPDIPLTSNPNLVGWWKLDEDQSTAALDWSGRGNHGTLVGDLQWVVGYDGYALEFDGGGDYVEVSHDASLTVDTEVTVMAWINAERHNSSGDWQGILAKSNNPRSYSFYTYVDGTLHFSTTSGGAYVGSNSAGQVPLNEWVHVTAMVEGGQHVYYINGEPAGTGGGGITLPGAADTATVWIGRTHESSNAFLGMIDDVRIYNKALTQEEVKQAMRGDPSLAWNPSPTNGSTPDVDKALPLTWSPGDDASEHDVYFGTDKDAVEYADISDTTGIYRDRRSTTSYTPLQGRQRPLGRKYLVLLA
jgi:hypothetical protein